MKSLLFALSVHCLMSSLAPAASEKPNILFIMSDDHSAKAFGVYPSRLAELRPTPNIDRLASEGMVLENVFCVNSICTPSRASILTGQYPQTNGVLDLGGRLPPEKQYLAHEMKKAGYLTAMIGKWHLKEEPASFDFYQVLPGQGAYFDPSIRVKGEGNWPNNEITLQGHCSDVVTDLSLNWLKNRDKSRPFFLMHHFKAPHGKWENAPRYDDYLSDVEIPEPDSLFTQPGFGSVATRGEGDSLVGQIGSSVSRRNGNNILLRLKNARTIKLKDDFKDLSDEAYTHAVYQHYLKRYLRCVKGIDDNVQRLIDFLKEEGSFDNTIIVYTSDQGMMLGEHDYIDKRWMYEESMRMPFIVCYPQAISAGSRSDAIINNTDFAPTLLDFAGRKTPDYMQGQSFKKILETAVEPPGWPQSTYYRYWMHMMHHANPAHFGIRTKNYKLIFYYACDSNGEKNTPSGWELYDVKNDSDELHNLYGKSEYRNIVAKLKADLMEQRVILNETDANYPEIQKVIAENWDANEL